MKSLPSFLVILSACVLSLPLTAQNLVPNPSFENNTGCPSTGGQINLAVPWVSPSTATPDYFNSCSTVAGLNTPGNFAGTEPPLTGLAYAGMIVYGPLISNYREYLQVQLSEPLVAGRCYEVSFNVSLAEDSDFAVDNLGAFVSAAPPSTPGTGVLIGTPQIVSNGIVSTTNGWVNISGIFAAQGGEQFLTIGSFVSDGGFQIANPNGGQEFAYYYVDDVAVLASAGTLTAAIAPPVPLSCSMPNTVLDASGSSTGPGITYAWDGPNGFSSTLQNPTVSTPGIYTLTVFDGLCSETIDVEVIATSTPPNLLINAVSTELNCNFPSLTLQGISTSTGISYLWEGVGQTSTTNTLTVAEPGTYTLTVTGTPDCFTTNSIVITEDFTPPDVQINGGAEINCSTLSTVLTASGSAGIFNFTWTDPDNNQIFGASITAVQGGEYSVFALALNGCTSITSVTVPENLTPPIAEAGPDTALGCNGAAVTISAEGSSQGPGFNLEWFDPNGSSLGANPSVEVTVAGMYSLSVTDASNGCTATDLVEVSAPTNLPIAVITPPDTISCSLPDVILDASNSTGANLLFEWSAPDNTPLGDSALIEVNQAGAYQLTVTNALNGCSATATASIAANLEFPIANAGPDGVLSCDDPAILLNAENSSIGPTIVFQWKNSAGDSLGNAPTLSVDQVGTYQLIVTDLSNGCAGLDSVDIIPDSNFVLALIQHDGRLTCTDSLVYLDATGSDTGPAITYTWLDENSVVIADSFSIAVSQPGVYSLVVENTVNGCSASTAVEVEQDLNAPIAEISGNNLLTCAQPDLLLLAGGSSPDDSLSFAWAAAGGLQLSDSDSLTVDFPGSYTLLVTDPGNGCTATDTLLIALDTIAPVPQAQVPGTLSCIQDTVNLFADLLPANATLQWFDPQTNFLSSDPSVAVDQTGSYTLVLTDTLNGCAASTELLVFSDYVLPNADAGPAVQLTCQDTQITLDASGSSAGPVFVYEWFNSNALSLGTTPTLTIDQSDQYVLSVTNTENGCTATDTVDVGINVALPVVTIQADDLLTCADTLITLTALGSDSGPGFLYAWLDENEVLVATDTFLQVGQAAAYQLQITNLGNGCTNEQTIQVAENTIPPLADAGQPATLDCTTTFVSLNGTGSAGGQGFSVQWTDATAAIIAIESELEVSQPGLYAFTVTDLENGCTATDQVQVDLDDDSPAAIAGTTNSLTCQNTEATLSAEGSSVGSSILYTWQDANGMPLGNAMTLSTTQPGPYTLIVSDTLNGCFTVAETTVVQDTLSPIAHAGAPDTLTCSISSIALDGSGSSLGSAFSYAWLDEEGQLIATTLSTAVNLPGIYSLEVFNSTNGCLETATVAITQDTLAPLAQLQTSGPINCVTPAVTLQTTGSTTSDNILLEWQNEAGIFLGNAATLSVNQAGVYTLLLTNSENGCTTSETAAVLEDLEAPFAQITPPDTITCSDPLVLVDAGASSSGPTISLEWLNPANQVIVNETSIETDLAGSYQLTVTDLSNGCTATAETVVVAATTPPDFQFAPTPQINCLNPTITLKVLGLPSDIPLSFQWLGGNGLVMGTEPDLVIDTTATYTLILTDLNNGCFTTDSITVTQDITPPIADAGIGDTLTCDQLTATLDGSNASGGPSFTYLWQNAQGDTLGTNPVASTELPGIYQLTVLNTLNGCLAQDEVVVALDTLSPTAIADVSGVLTCTQVTIELSTGGSTTGPGISYQWIDEAGLPFDDAPIVEIGQAGSYTLIVTNNSNGCSETADLTVQADTIAPIAQAGPPAFLDCTTPSSFLSGAGSSTGPQFMFAWIDEQGLLLDTSLNLPVNAAGVYALVVTNAENGCTASDVTEVFIDIELPVAVLLPPVPLDCANLSTFVAGTGSSTGPDFAYNWTGPGIVAGGNTLSAEVSAAGLYTLTVLNNQNGCFASETTEVLVIDNAPAATIFFDPGTCIVDNAVIDVVNVQGGEAPYLYSIDGGQTFLSNNQFVDLNAGSYTIVVEDSRGCRFEETIVIPQINLPVVALDAEIEIALGEITTLEVQTSIPEANIQSILWTPATGLSCTDCLEPEVEITEDQLYELQITTLEGCVVVARTLVQVNREAPKIYIPNVFSPNGDGLNDGFRLFSTDPQIVAIRTFQVYSRWGELLYRADNFQPDDPSTAWDGTFRAQKMDPGVYVYWFELELVDGASEVIKGDVTLVR